MRPSPVQFFVSVILIVGLCSCDTSNNREREFPTAKRPHITSSYIAPGAADRDLYGADYTGDQFAGNNALITGFPGDVFAWAFLVVNDAPIELPSGLVLQLNPPGGAPSQRVTLNQAIAANGSLRVTGMGMILPAYIGQVMTFTVDIDPDNLVYEADVTNNRYTMLLSFVLPTI